MGKHLVLAGGGHAHLATLADLARFVARGHRVTVVGPSPYHYYSGMAPGALAGTYRPREIRFHIRRMVTDRGGSFVQDKVVAIEPQRRELMLDSGGGLTYDVVSFNLGSRVSSGRILTSNRFLFPVKPIVNIVRAREAAHRLIGEGRDPVVEVVGGGPAGVELAAAAAALLRRENRPVRVGLTTGASVLAGYPDRIRRMAVHSLAGSGVTLRENTPVLRVDHGTVVTQSGPVERADIVLLAVGVRPAPLFLNSLVPTGEDGGLLVNRQLRSVAFPEIFGGGDCITLKGQILDRVGVYAVRQNPVLAHNLLASLEGRTLRTFDPGSPRYLQILNLSDGTAIFRKGNFVVRGRLAFTVKDRIDRKFMRKYQLSGEREEED